MLSAASSTEGQGNPVLGILAALLCIGCSYILASRWAKTIKARADGEPRGQVTPGAWVVIGVVVAFFVITTILNATGVW